MNSPGTPIAFLNGAFLPFHEAKLPIYDRGIVQGATITERMRTFGHKAFFVQEHLDRLGRTLERLEWTLPTPLDQLPGIIEELVRHNCARLPSEGDLAIVVFVTAGDFVGDANGYAVDGGPPTLCIYTAPLSLATYARWYRDGIGLAIPAGRHIPPESLDPNIKCRSRMHWYLADREAFARGGDMAVLLDQDGYVTETSSGNLFVVTENTLRTPLERTTLPGISQRFVMELAERSGFEVRRTNISPDYVARYASEAFLTSSTYCIAPVTSLNAKPIGEGTVGPVVRRLWDAWAEVVGIDFASRGIDAPRIS